MERVVGRRQGKRTRRLPLQRRQVCGPDQRVVRERVPRPALEEDEAGVVLQVDHLPVRLVDDLLHQGHGPAVHEQDGVIPRVVVGGLSEVLLRDAPRAAEVDHVDPPPVLLPVDGLGFDKQEGSRMYILRQRGARQ